MDIRSIKWRRGLNLNGYCRGKKKIPEICGQYRLTMKMILLLPLPWRLNSNISWHSTWKTPTQPIITIFISTIIQLSPPSRSTTHVDGWTHPIKHQNRYTYEGIHSRESLHPIMINTRLSPCLYGDLNHVGRRVRGDHDLVGKLREEMPEKYRDMKRCDLSVVEPFKLYA